MTLLCCCGKYTLSLFINRDLHNCQKRFKNISTRTTFFLKLIAAVTKTVAMLMEKLYFG